MDIREILFGQLGLVVVGFLFVSLVAVKLSRGKRKLATWVGWCLRTSLGTLLGGAWLKGIELLGDRLGIGSDAGPLGIFVGVFLGAFCTLLVDACWYGLSGKGYKASVE